MRIGLITIYVDDQNQAEQFYTEALGFQVETSAPYGPSERWLSMVSPEEPDGLQLALHLADEHAWAFQAACRRIGRPVFSLLTDDCRVKPSGSRPRAWCSSRNPQRCPTAA
jgi:catechol 2,3-dioxygenase-like lactoylglutathione lyase family enzyme